MLQKLFNFIYSTKAMAVALILFFVAMAVATFIENDFGTRSAKALIYNAKWFELLMLFLVINFIGNMFRFRMYQKSKWPVLLFHVAFIIILLGAFVTRYFGYEGIMPIREGTKTNVMYSDKSYILTSVDDGQWQKSYSWPVLFSKIGSNNFDVTDKFGKTNPKNFSIKLVDFIPHAKETFVKDATGDLYLHLVESGSGMRKDYYLKNGDLKSIRNILFSFNNPVEGGMNFFSKDGKHRIQTPFDGKLMDMKTQKISAVVKDSIQPLTLLQLYNFNDQLKFVIPEITKGKIVKVSAAKQDEQKYPFDAVTLEISSGGDSKQIELRGTTGAEIKPEVVHVGDLNFKLNYGSKKISLPFTLELRDFIMDRYPGTNSPSSYASEVTVIDKDKSFFYRIFMNHVLDYKGYRFYQSSFDPDEKGTILSVNHDKAGTLITYFGYFLMGLGMFISLFWPGTRFKKLSDKVKAISKTKFGVILILFFMTTGLQAQQAKNFGTLDQNTVKKSHAEKFGRLLIQDHQGRVKPMNTYALETLRKIYKKDHYKGKTAEQVILSAQVRPAFWARQKMIKTKPYALGNKLSKMLKVNDHKMTALIDYFTPSGQYVLEQKVAEAYQKKKSQRTATDVEIINLDEKVNIWLAGLKGSLMNIYPKKDDPNHKWYNGMDHNAFTGKDTMVLSMHRLYLSELNKAIKTGNYTKANEYLSLISDYQQQIGKAIIPSQKKIDLEIVYNRWNIFKLLLFYYMAIGFLLLILSFIDLFKPKNKTVQVLMKILFVLIGLGMLAHVAGLGIRWYISGHEPWSNGYEAVVFVAFVTVLAGLIFSVKKSKFTLATATLFASFLLGIAHGSLMNPEITNLVPVLKSYWLMIHVAVITASYGFLGLSAILGLTVLILYILRNQNNKALFKNVIEELTAVSEMSMTVGLYTLALGTFLGGVWANESWGRYWSWDPKEVWSLISMMVFVLVLHMRIIPGLRGQFAFNLAALFSIATLIMTFFGVNFYLSGMHSYATGDPVPIPAWVYPSIAFFVLLSIISYIRYKKVKSNK